MKTHFLVRNSMNAIILSFVLISCEKENSLSSPDKNPVVTDSSIKTNLSDPEGIYQLDKSDTLQIGLSITKEMEAEVSEVVKPVKEIVEKILNEDKTGFYKAYKQDVEKLGSLKDNKEKILLIEEIQEKYLVFFKEVWEKSDIDEKEYQSKIKNIFPKELQETIQFTEFLNFSMHGKKHTRDNPPAPAPPAPANICIDAMTMWFGISKAEKSLFSRADVIAVPHMVESHTVSEVAGYSNGIAGLASNITIPGTFPDDDKLLRVKKSFQWNGGILAISILGCSFATMQYTTLANEEFYRLWAPITWLSFKDIDEPRTEEYLIQKRYMYNIRYGVSVYSDTYAGAAALSFAHSRCENLKWSICEE